MIKVLVMMGLLIMVIASIAGALREDITMDRKDNK